MPMDIFVTILTTFGNITLAYLALKKDRKNATHITFAAMNVAVAILNIINIIPLYTSNPAVTLWWIRGAIFFVPVYLVSILGFVYTFPSRTFHFPSRKILLLILTLSFAAMILAFTPFVFSGISFTVSGTPIPLLGNLMFVYAFIAIFLVLLPVALLIYRYRNISGYEKSRLGFLLVGIILSVALLAIFNFLCVILFQTSAFIPYSPFFIMVFVVFSFLAIVRFRFLNIRVAIQRNSLSLATFLIFLVLTFTFATLLVEQIQYAFVFIPLFAILFTLVPWMRTRVARRIERMFLFEEVDFAEYLDLDRYRLGTDNARKHAFELQADLRKVFDLPIDVYVSGEGNVLRSVSGVGAGPVGYTQKFFDWFMKYPEQEAFVSGDVEHSHEAAFLRVHGVSAVFPLRLKGVVFGALVVRETKKPLSSDILERLKSNARGAAYVFDAIANFERSHRAWRISLYRKQHGIPTSSTRILRHSRKIDIR